MKPQTAVVLGATGLIGNNLVKLLLDDEAFSKVRVLVRRPYEMQHAKLEVQHVNFDDITDFKDKLGLGDSIFCCVGTTNSKVKGDKSVYRKVDYNIPVNAARLGLEAAFSNFLLVSSVGANAASNNFYIKLKGEVEEVVSKVPLQRVHILQPSMLLGDRKEFRLGESIGKGVMKGLSFAFAGSIQKYKGIEASDVAKAMVAASKIEVNGVRKYQYKEMMELIKQDQHQE